LNQGKYKVLQGKVTKKKEKRKVAEFDYRKTNLKVKNYDIAKGVGAVMRVLKKDLKEKTP